MCGGAGGAGFEGGERSGREVEADPGGQNPNSVLRAKHFPLPVSKLGRIPKFFIVPDFF